MLCVYKDYIICKERDTVLRSPNCTLPSPEAEQKKHFGLSLLDKRDALFAHEGIGRMKINNHVESYFETHFP